jgi:hypothetical protein
MQKLTLEQKEQLKKARKEAYLKMKEKRDNDPKYITLKEAQKKKRKEIYQGFKNRRNADKKAKRLDEQKKRAEKLLKMVGTATNIIPKGNTDT